MAVEEEEMKEAAGDGGQSKDYLNGAGDADKKEHLVPAEKRAVPELLARSVCSVFTSVFSSLSFCAVAVQYTCSSTHLLPTVSFHLRLIVPSYVNLPYQTVYIIFGKSVLWPVK
jgi:hypothetical protein